MLAIQPQGKIVEKIVRTKSGQFVSATFFVSENDGRLTVRLLSVTPVAQSAKSGTSELQTANCGLFLTGFCAKRKQITAYFSDLISNEFPFSSIFEFFVSQPTRAPSFGF